MTKTQNDAIIIKDNQVLIYLPEGVEKEGVNLKVCAPIAIPLINGKEPHALWTTVICNPAIKLKLPLIPTHKEGMFLESKGNDWYIVRGHLIYRSGLSEGGCWLLLEY